MSPDYRVISTDNHLVEAPHAFDRLPARFQDRKPRIMRGPDGGDGWSYDGKPPTFTFGLNAMAGIPYENYKRSGLTLDEILPGNYDGAAHLKDMDVDGVDAAVVYPSSLVVFTMEDREFALAVMRAANDWLLDDFCAADSDRLWGLPLVPVDDGMDELLAETERVAAKGARGVLLPFYAEHPYHDPYYDPFWKVLSEAGMAASVHRTMGGRPPKSEVIDLVTPGTNVAGIVYRFLADTPLLTNLIFTGLFQRFPDLHFVAGEVNCGWIPFWVQMMEQEYERQRHWSGIPLATNPTAFVGENVFCTTLDDNVGFELARDHEVVARSAMFSTDYPHSVTLWPKSKEYIETLTKGLPEDRKHAILAGNALRAYGVKVPA